MAEKFSAAVSAWALKSKARTDAIVKQSVQDVINDAQTPMAKGGRMRVDTGFLRASGQASLTGMPTGPGRGSPDGTYPPDTTSVIVTIANAKVGEDRIFFGWTANYARYRESRDAFLRLAVQKWDQIVSSNVAKAKARFK